MSENNTVLSSGKVFAANLKRLRKAKGLTQEALGNALGVKKSCISNYEKNLSVPDISRLLQIAELFEIDLSQLVGYRSPSSLHDNTEDDRSAPVLNKIEYGVHPLYNDNIIDTFVLPSINLRTGDFFGFIIPDNSMSRSKLKKGDVAVIRRQPIASTGDIVLIAHENQPPLLRKAYVMSGDVITLMPDSDDISFAPVTLDPTKDNFDIVGKVSYVYVTF